MLKLPQELRFRIANELMAFVLRMTDEQMKKDTNHDSLNKLIFTIRDISTFREPLSRHSEFHEFWLEFALKLSRSGSIVLKLYSWDVIQNLADFAVRTRPQAGALFLVIYSCNI